MYEVSYFVHIAGVILWIGAFLSFGLLLNGLLHKGEADDQTGGHIRRIVNRIILPSSFLVVLSGSYMISQFDRETMPLYLSLMEMGGTMIVLLSIIALSILSRKITKALGQENRASLYRYYRTTIMISAILGLGVVLIVAMRLM